jgi:hypothetical protein
MHTCSYTYIDELHSSKSECSVVAWFMLLEDNTAIAVVPALLLWEDVFDAGY